MQKEVSPTNSPIGSQHWFNTLLGSILHMGEYIANKFDGIDGNYGKLIQQNAAHLMENYAKIAAANLDEMGQQVAHLLNRINEVENVRNTVLMLEILHECPDAQEAGYEYTEAWPFQDTEAGLAAANAAIQEDIERCKNDPDTAPFVNARIWRCTANEHGAYTNAEEVVTVNLYETDEP